METDMQNDVNNMFLKKAQLTIDLNPDKLVLCKIGNLFPFLTPLVIFLMASRAISSFLFRKLAPAWFLPQIEEFAPVWIFNRVENIIKTKTSSKSKDDQSHSVDLLQLMLDASTKNDVNVNNYIFFFFTI
jgi:hypothetical protein